jgi:predicted transcriptional regulator
LTPQEPLSRAVELILRGSQQDFPVVDGERVVGVLTRAVLLPALAKSDQTTPVAEIMERTFQMAEADEMLEAAFQRLQQCKCRTMPVTEDGRLVGLLTQENLGEFMLIRTALDEHRAATGETIAPPPYV